jgi:hypothetical protein
MAALAGDFEDKEDPLKDTKPLTIIEDEEDESGGGIDYRRMFKGFPPSKIKVSLTFVKKGLEKVPIDSEKGRKGFRARWNK